MIKTIRSRVLFPQSKKGKEKEKDPEFNIIKNVPSLPENKLDLTKPCM